MKRGLIALLLIIVGGVTATVSLAARSHGTETSPPAAVQAPALPGGQPISSRDRVYTADQTSNTVSVIDPKTDTVLGTIPLGAQRLGATLGPQYLQQVDVHGLGFSRDGRYLDVVSVTTNSVTVISTATNGVVSQTSVGRASHEGFFTPDGKQVWVAARGLAEVDIVDALHGGLVDRIATGPNPSKVVFSPDGRFAYVNHIASPTIDVIRVASRRVVARIGGLADVFSSDEALSPDGRELWAAHKKVGKVSVIDVARRKVIAVLDTGPGTNHPNFVTTSTAAYAYVTVGGLNQTLVYRRNGAASTLVARIPSSGSEPHGIWPSPDNTRVYVVNERSDTVDVIDTATTKVIDTLHVGQEGQALLYVANAVPSGPGTAGLTQQELGQKVVNAKADLRGSVGEASTTSALSTGSRWSRSRAANSGRRPRTPAYGNHAGELIPLLSFTTDETGAEPQALAFVRFFGIYADQLVVAPAAIRP